MPNSIPSFACLVACAAAFGCGDNLTGPTLPSEAGVPAAAPPDARPLGIIMYTCQGDPAKPRVLVYTFENLWRHYSNMTATQAIYDMCTNRGYSVMTTNDPMAINAANLSQVDVIVFAVSSGPGLNSLAQADLEAWLRAGGGMVGIHSASATEPSWPFYVADVGTTFAGHSPGLQTATVQILSDTHPVTAGLANFTLTDEWYFFTRRPENVPGMEMLLALDESSLPADYPAMYKQGFHPIAWAHELYGGRVFYTAFGHNPDDWTDPNVLEITARGIEWAAHKR
jgi:type 1 glutamine amidotransferase